MIRVYLDANILIAAFEDRSATNEFVWRVLKVVEDGSITAATSQITLAEVLPRPLANNQLDLVRVYEDLLTAEDVFDVLPVTAENFRGAARIGAERLGIKLPDAIHLATARSAGCQAIFTGDKRLLLPSGLPVVEPGPNSLHQLQAFAS